ncbi:MAG: Ig-like domain-containing protein, partial [Polyangia bacterium]
FVIMGSNDSGKPPGAFHMFDVKDPRAPKLLASLVGTPEVANLRELHAMPVAMIDGKDILVFPTLTGIVFFDFTNVLMPKMIGSLALSGVSGGDYDNAAWMLSWAYPYVYVGGTGNGIYIVDATDPTKPTLVTRVPTGSMGNFRIGPTYAAGNYVVGIGMDQSPTKISVLDVSNPKSPFLLTTGSTAASLYSAIVVGDRIYGPGTNGDYSFVKWTPTAITTIGTGKSGSDRGGYCTYQSSFVICGQSSEGYKKWDVHNDAKPMLVGHGTDPAGVGGDFDFATIVGNLVYLGNDHGTGAALVPHQMGPDNTAPTVVQIFPSEGDTKQALTSRVTVFLSEDYDIGSVSPTSMIVRKAGGAAIEGTFSKSSFNALSFGPKAPLEANSTYEVVIPAGGLKDLVGNPIATAAMARFSTGATLTGGAGGAGGSVSTGSGGVGGRAGAGGVTGATGGASPSGSGGTASGTGGGTVVATGGTTVVGSGGAVGTTGGSGPAVGTGGASSTGGAGAVGATGGGSAGCGCDVSNGGGGGTGTARALSLFVVAILLGLRKKRSARQAALHR